MSDLEGDTLRTDVKVLGNVPGSSYDSATWISRLCFFWLSPILSLGNKRTLETSDLLGLPVNDSTQTTTDLLEENWKKELSKPKPLLVRAVWNIFGRLYMLFGILLFLEECCVLLQSVILMHMLVAMEDLDNSANVRYVWLLTAAMAVSVILTNVFDQPYFFHTNRLGIRLRVSCCSLVFQKILRLNQQALAQTTTGHIINLITNDVRRFDQSIFHYHYLWLGPVSAIASIAVLWNNVGVASLVGMLVLVSMTPLQIFFGKIFSKLRLKTALCTDERIKLVSEIVNGIRIVKMYCWEHMFQKYVHKVRSQECRHIMHMFACQCLGYGQILYQLKLALLGMLGVMVWRDVEVHASHVFTAFLLYSRLRLIICLYIPECLISTADMMVAFRRIQTFLLLPELSDSIEAIPTSGEKEMEIVLDDFTTNWNKDSRSNMVTLDKINLVASGPQLIIVAGPVGSGKTSLLMAMLKELPGTSGTLRTTGQIAYASQQAWVFSDTIRENILFKRPMDQEVYERIITVTALDKDLSIFEKGDLTQVGERGTSLSGGQRARIGLARALYSRADIFLLDDPLAAVDPRVNRIIFEEAVQKLLKGKLVVLVTHQVQFLPSADQIVILEAGKMTAFGSYSKLVEQGVDVAAFAADGDDETEIKEQLQVDAPRNLGDSSTMLHLIAEADTASCESLNDPVYYELVTEPDQEPIAMETMEPSEKAEEQVQTGNVSYKVYLSYLGAAGHWSFVFAVFLFFLATQLSSISSDYWLSVWTTKQKEYRMNFTESVSIPINSSTEQDHRLNITQLPVINVDAWFYLSVYGYLCLALLIISFLRSIFYFYMCVRASSKLHQNMFQRLLYTEMRFFDTNSAATAPIPPQHNVARNIRPSI